MFRSGIRPCFRHQWVAFVGRMLLRPYTCYMPYMKIRPCFPNRGYIPVGDTDMFSPHAGGACGAYAVAPLHVLHAIHKNTDMFFERGTRYPSKYVNVFRTGYALSIKIRTCFPNPVHVVHQNTDVFSEPDTHYPSKYERVFRTGYTSYIKIRIRFPNRIYVIHQNMAVFSESGEGVDEPEDGEEDDGGAYDAVQYADAANVEPSAEA